jgi:phytoene dehydrogenase-like protein
MRVAIIGAGIAGLCLREGWLHIRPRTTVITDPACLAELWELIGQRLDRNVDLVPVCPFYRLSWPDGFSFNYGNDKEALRLQIDPPKWQDMRAFSAIPRRLMRKDM